MVSEFDSSVVDPGFDPRLDQTNDYKIDISYFSSNHAAIRRKIKDWLAWNQDNVSEWGDMSIRGMLFQWASTMQNPTERVGLVHSGPHHQFSEN
jgi:hypothetical protein